MDSEKNQRGLEALAGRSGTSPAKASAEKLNFFDVTKTLKNLNMFKINLLLLVTLSACSHVDTPEAPAAPPGPQVTPPKVVTPSPPVSKTAEKSRPVISLPASFPFNQPQKWPDSSNYVKRGLASWYGLSEHGVKTASGEVYDLYNMTAAHATLPLHTRVRVKNLRTGKSVIVTINDRLSGSQALIKLSYYTARRLGLLNSATSEVEVRGLKSP